MKTRLVAFDVDATLAEVGEPVTADVARRVVNLERQGIQLLFNSGKSAYYLAGFARGLGVRRPLLVGENGCVLLDLTHLDEVRLAVRPKAVDEVQQFVLSQYGPHVWLQPNQVALTIFPKDPGLIPTIASAIREYLKPFPDPLTVVDHIDAIDIFPHGIDKGQAMREVKRRYGYQTKEIIAVGDSVTDLPMFQEAGTQLIVGQKIHYSSASSAATIEDALTLLEGFIHDR